MMIISVERVKSSPEAIDVATAVTSLAELTFSKLVRQYPVLGITERDVAEYYEDGLRSVPGQSFWRAVSGQTVNRLGSRRAQMYTAMDVENNEIVGWLTTAADHSNNYLHRLKKSYLWLVNGGVHPEYQGHGIMRNLLERALTDPRRPDVFSFTTHVSAYPLVAPPESGVTLPAEAGLQALDFEKTGEPFEDSAAFGKPTFIRRYEGISPGGTAQKLS